MEVSCLALPPSLEVVESNFAGAEVADDWVLPLRQLNNKASLLGAEEFGGAVNRRRQSEPPAGSPDCGTVTDFGLDGYNMTQSGLLSVSRNEESPSIHGGIKGKLGANGQFQMIAIAFKLECPIFGRSLASGCQPEQPSQPSHNG